jgi:hypothetical protein
MAQYEHLPVYKKAMDMTVYIETIVRGFPRYHKYTIGSEMRALSHKILVLMFLRGKRGCLTCCRRIKRCSTPPPTAACLSGT